MSQHEWVQVTTQSKLPKAGLLPVYPKGVAVLLVRQGDELHAIQDDVLGDLALAEAHDIGLVHRWLSETGRANWLGSPAPTAPPAPLDEQERTAERVRALVG